MSGFLYNGKSTETIIESSKLILVSTSGAVDDIQGTTRELQGGEPTISRPIVNEYGTLGEHLEFEYSLMKEDGTSFTKDEQRIVEKWLTSPKFSSTLTTIDCDANPHFKYLGKFTKTSWKVGDDYMALDFTFSVNGSYAYETYSFYAETPTTAALDRDHNKNWSFYINCETDEPEEWVYPKMTIKTAEGANSPSFTLTNTTDGSRKMIVDTTRTDQFVFDCRHCIATASGGDLTFEDIAWDNIENIYWMRLKSGSNYISVVGDLTILIEYDSPVKIAGGWLV